MLYLDKRGGIPLELTLLIGQSAPVELADLNGRDLPDAFWLGLDGKSYGVEIKQPGECLGRLDDVEEQLAREYTQVDNLSLCICGVVVPCESRGCKVLQFTGDGKSGYVAGIRGGGPYAQDYGGYRAKLQAWQAWGLQVCEVPTKLALARHLVAAYNYAQKPAEAHKTFRTPLRVKHDMPVWDSYQLTVMSLYDPATGRTFIGPDRAKSLMDAFGSPAELFGKTAKEIAAVAGIGPKTAEGILRAVGKGE